MSLMITCKLEDDDVDEMGRALEDKIVRLAERMRI